MINDPFELFDESFEEEWKEAESKEVGEVPNGSYVVLVKELTLAVSEKGNPYLNWQLIVAEGQYEGRYIFKKSMLHTPGVKGMLKGELSKLNIVIEPPFKTGIVKVIEKLSNSVLKVKTSTSVSKGIEYNNVEIKGFGNLSTSSKTTDAIPF